MMTVFALLYKEMVTQPVILPAEVREPVPRPSKGGHPKAASPDNYQYMFTVINILYRSHSMIDNPIIDIIGVYR